jgi:hypothetical protein
MAVTLQHLRTSTATKIPTTLAAGQVAFNLANGWLFVGTGGDDILVKGVVVSAYATTATIYGVTGVTIPAKPTGGGYEIYQLAGGGVSTGGTLPPSPVVGQVFVNTSVAGKPAMLVWNGTAWVPPINPPAVYSLSGAEYAAGTGTGVTAKVAAALTTKLGAAPTLHSGDTLIVGGTGADAGTYIYDGTTWAKSGGSLPDATAQAAGGGGGTKGVVYLARDTDVRPTAAAGATAPDALAVATGAQMKALAELVAGLTTGSTLLGTYDGSAGGKIASVTPAASAGGRTTFAVGTKITAGGNAKEGDYFLVIKAGTPTGEPTALNVALNANDHLVYDGANWHVVASGVVAATPFSINSAADFAGDTAAGVAAADQKGLMLRDGSVAAAGSPNAWKLVSTIDCGTF